MSICRVPSTISIYAKLVNPLLCVAIILALLYVGQEVLIPLAFSVLFSILLISPCRFFEKRGLNRGFASLITLLLAVIIFFVIFYFVASSIIGFKKDLPVMVTNINQMIFTLEAWAREKFHLSPQKVQDLVQSATSQILPTTSLIVNRAITTITHVFFLSILIIITTFLLLLYRGLVVRFFISLFAEEYAIRINGVFSKTRFIIKSYLFGLFIEMLIVAAANCTGFLLLGIKYAFFLGIMAALLNLIPYLGIFMACLLASLITLTTGLPHAVIGVVIVMLIIHMTDSNILMPKVVGSKVKINALVTIMGVITGSAIWGIPGTFLAVPMMAILKVIFEDIEAFHPFAILMGDDHEVASMSKPMIRKIIYRVSKKAERNKAP